MKFENPRVDQIVPKEELHSDLRNGLTVIHKDRDYTSLAGICALDVEEL
ncbi:hypothetical protein L0222_24265 [bacterium]|nr:hypothetical protein [bacterium]